MFGAPIPQQLHGLIRDPRYRQRGAEGDAYRSAVATTFRAQYGDGSQGGLTFVDEYQRRDADGNVQTVSAHLRSVPQRAWEGQPNEAWRQQIAREESNREGADHGYGMRNSSGTAFGRYQVQRPALSDAGWWNLETRQWTAHAQAHGIRGDDDFLANGAAQEVALTDVMRTYQNQLRTNGAYRRIGQQITGMDGNSTRITESGLVAAAHREGARAVRDYLVHREAGLPRPRRLQRGRGPLSIFNEIERRLRGFADTRYDAIR